jgi:hypothetical protein
MLCIHEQGRVHLQNSIFFKVFSLKLSPENSLKVLLVVAEKSLKVVFQAQTNTTIQNTKHAHTQTM